MPIVIVRNGEIPQMSGSYPQERRDTAWATIVKNWTEKNADRFREMLESEQPNAGESK